jgi:hypothetical protein
MFVDGGSRLLSGQIQLATVAYYHDAHGLGRHTRRKGDETLLRDDDHVARVSNGRRLNRSGFPGGSI